VNFYKRFIGDIQRDTGHLSCAEMGVYDRLLDHYYATEQPLPPDIDACCRIARAMTKDERKAVESILRQFFTLNETGYMQGRAERELLEAQPKLNAARTNGAKGGRPKKNPTDTVTKTQEKPTGFSNETQHESSPEPEPEPELKPSGNDTLPETLATPSASSPPPEKKLNGYGAIAVELIGLGVKVTSMHPTLISWVDEGFTIEQMREAVAVARQSKPAPETIPAKYLDVILRSKPKGRELGMRPKGGESYQEYKARIQAELTKRGGKHGN
jgi:uncharacterized protein YdaU (DUF1376 family)